MLRRSTVLTGRIPLSLLLAGCSLGETTFTNPTPLSGPAAPNAEVSHPIPGPIPHSVEGRFECFVCHDIGGVDAPSVPEGHARNTDLCTSCHAIWTQPGIASIAPPAISHAVVGSEDCLACHKLGTAGAPRFPSIHAGLSIALCQTCHVVGEDIEGATTESASLAAPIPHGREGFAACILCHSEGAGGAPRYPPDHAGRSDDTCMACHQPSNSDN